MRKRLVLSIGLSSLFISAIACLIVWLFSQQQLHQRLDNELQGTASHTARRGIYEYYLALRWQRDHPDEVAPKRTDIHTSYCLFDPETKKVYHHTDDLNSKQASSLLMLSKNSTHHTTEISPQNHMRAYTFFVDMSKMPRFRRGPPIEFPKQLAVIVAKPLKDIHDSEQDLAIALLIVTLLSSSLCAISAAIIGSQTVRPIKQLSTSIGDINAHALDQPIDLVNAPLELNPIIQGLNQALNRLSEAFQREKQLTADLAHELRTPLAVIRSELEQLKSITENEPHQLARNAHCAAVQMQRLAERILLLSRLESGLQQIETSSIDLADECEQRWSMIKRNELQFEHDISLSACLKTDKTLLRMVLDNLFGNAVSYAPANSTVKLTFDESDLTLVIQNTCITDTPIDCEAAFTLYWRADTARSDTESHAGLGLPLVKRMMTSMGGDVFAEHDVEKQLFSIHLKWPTLED